VKGNGHRRGASLYEFRDLDLLFRLAEAGGEEGWAETEALAELIGLDDNRPVGTRLAWMRRYGMTERSRDGLWRPTAAAERVRQARIRAAAQRTLEALPEESMIETMAAVTARYRLADPMIAAMLRREFLFGTKR